MSRQEMQQETLRADRFLTIFWRRSAFVVFTYGQSALAHSASDFAQVSAGEDHTSRLQNKGERCDD